MCIFRGLGKSNKFFALETLMTNGIDTKADRKDRREIKTIKSILMMGWFRIDNWTAGYVLLKFTPQN